MINECMYNSIGFGMGFGIFIIVWTTIFYFWGLYIGYNKLKVEQNEVKK